jgi:hypothetical protein
VNFLQLDEFARESMTERAFWPQFIEQVLGTLKRLGSEMAILEQTGPTPRNFAFGQQGNAPFLIVRIIRETDRY